MRVLQAVISFVVVRGLLVHCAIVDHEIECEKVYNESMANRMNRMNTPFFFLSLLNDKGVFRASGPRTLFLHVGKTGGGSFEHMLKANEIHWPQLHVYPLDMDMVRYYDNIIIGVRDPMERLISAFNFAQPNGEEPLKNSVYNACFPNISVAADMIFDDTACGALFRNPPGSHMAVGYCFYMGGRIIRKALREHNATYVIREESFDADMEYLFKKLAKKNPPYKTASPVHAGSHLSREVTPTGAANLRKWLELKGEYDLYREILSIAANGRSRSRT